MANLQYFNTIISIPNVGNDKIAISTPTDISYKETTTDSGSATQKNKYEISGKVYPNKKTTVATIFITAESGTYFIKAPSLSTSFSKNIKIKKNISKREDSKITQYIIHLYYTNSKQVFNDEGIIGEISYETKTLISGSILLNRVTFGNYVMLNGGETRKISIHGSPGATFGIAINESDITGTDEYGDYITHKHNDTSILSNSNETVQYNYGKDMRVVKGTLGDSGVYSFNQKFPNTIVHKTKTTSSVSGSTVQLSSTSGLRDGDRIIAREIPRGTHVYVDDVNSSTTITTDASVTLSNNAEVLFKRPKAYSIDIIPELSSDYASTIPTSDPEYIIYQHDDTKITLKTSTTDSNISINGLSGGTDIETTYTGSFGSTPASASTSFGPGIFKHTLLLTTVDSKVFTATTKTPSFSKTSSDRCSWKAFDASGGNPRSFFGKKNGGNEVSIGGIKKSKVGLGTLTITFIFRILRFGSKNLHIELNLDDILHTAAP